MYAGVCKIIRTRKDEAGHRTFSAANCCLKKNSTASKFYEPEKCCSPFREFTADQRVQSYICRISSDGAIN